MRYALKDGLYVNVDEVPKGLNCGCTCPICGEEVVARKGDVNSHHFAHRSDSSCRLRNSGGGGESDLHWYIKECFIELISKDIKIGRGSLEDIFGCNLWLNEELRWFTLPCIDVHINDVILEKDYKGIRPDILLKTDKGDILVEVAVHHYIDEEKLKKIKDISVLCLEFSIKEKWLLDEIYRGDFNLKFMLEKTCGAIRLINDKETDEMLEFLYKNTWRYKTYPVRDRTGTVVHQIYDPPCVRYKTIYALKCRDCKNLLYIKEDELGNFTEVGCGKRYGLTSKLFADNYGNQGGGKEE